MNAALLLLAWVVPSTTWIVVGPAGPHTTVAAGIAAAAPHDTVWVQPGVYDEPTLVLDRPVTLVGAPGAVLDGGGERGLVVIRSDSVTVRGLTFRDTGISFTEDRAAVLVDGGRFCTLEGNTFVDTFFGIYLANAGDCRVAGNTLTANATRETRAGNGIHLWYSKRVRVEDNRIAGHRDGIYFEFVEDSDVERNDSADNVRYGLHFMFSDGCRYRNNRFAANGAGVAVMYTRDVLMVGNDFDRNRGMAAYGLLLKDIRDSRLEGNRFRDNSVGLYAEGVTRLTVEGNDFTGNGWAIQLMANSEGSSFVRNTFLANSFDVSTNSRRTHSRFEGNYWDRYRGYDLDRNGAGDVPFHPVRLFALLSEQTRPILLLHRSLLVLLLDVAEQILPVLTPANLVDERPLLTPPASSWRMS